MINFAVGPVQSDDAVLQIGGSQIPYFRTDEFSSVMKENEKYMLEFTHASNGSKAVFLTSSGTGAMEASVMNVLTEKDKAIVINGGSFGNRFCQICNIHHVPFSEIKLPYGKTLTADDLNAYDNQGYTALLVNVCETSTGILYDMDLISSFCKKNKMLLIADCISSFLTDSFDMQKYEADVMITGSQKALACAPGVSIIVLSERALEIVNNRNVESLYFDLKTALKDQERGQTPFTPGVGILLQIHKRLSEIEKNGGVVAEIQRTSTLAQYFRDHITDLPLTLFPDKMSNCVTALKTNHTEAYSIFETLKNEYGIWVCPNGGELKNTVFRVGHIGNLRFEEYDSLVDSLKDLVNRGILL